MDSGRQRPEVVVSAVLTPGFHEDWFGDHSCNALTALVNEVADVDGLIVEIGSWEGRSTIALANAAHPRIVQAVDTWDGSPGELSATLAKRRDVYAQWSTNISHYTRRNVIPRRMGWREFVADYDYVWPIALVFVDAEHSYTEVRDTIAAFRPLMASGGIMCGDDVHHEGVNQAVREAFPYAVTSATLWIGRIP
jgi:predicted O-methyltransferase YrrM